MKILAAIDRSEFADLVFDKVHDLACAGRDEVLLLNAAPRAPDTLGHQITRKIVVDDVPEELKVEARLLNGFAQRLQEADILSSTLIARGQPGKVILREATDWGADLIVVGSHGRSLLYRSLVGSVSEEVLGARQFPVLVVPSPHPPESV